MKINILWALTVASAKDLFLENEGISLADESLYTYYVGNGACQPNQKGDFFDLKQFDALREVKHHMPTVIEDGTNKFMYKACQPEFELKAGMGDFDKFSDASGKHNAWLVDKDGKVEYTFGLAAWKGNSQISTGWSLTYTSQEDCTANTKKTVTINAQCEEKSTGWNKMETDGCASQVTYGGKEACVAFHVNLAEVANTLAPYFGAIAIVLGGFLCFTGRKFIFFFAAVLLSIVVCLGLFLISYNLFLPAKMVKASVVIPMLVVFQIIGGVLGYFAYKLLKHFAISLIAGVGAAAGILVLLSAAGVDNGYVILGLTIAGAIAGVVLGRIYRKHVATICTAFIGAYMINRGISMYAGGFPNEMRIAKEGDVELSKAFYGYMAGIAVATIAGIVVQYKIFGDDDVEEELGEKEGGYKLERNVYI